MNSIEQLISYLNDSGEETRAGAVRRLGELKDSRAIDFLLKAYKDETYTMQIAEAPPA